MTLTLAKRCLSKQEAMEYCGCDTMAAFDAWVSKRIIPAAIPGTRRWDKNAIDAALDRASGLIAPSGELSPYQQWKTQREGQHQGR